MSDTTETPPIPPSNPPAEPRSGWSAGRVVMAVIGSILALIGLGALLLGGVVMWAALTQRDDGFFHTDEERFSSAGYAIVSDEIDLGADARPGDWGVEPGDLFRVRLRATATNVDVPIFIGVARSEDVDRYLANVPHDVVRDVDMHPFRVRYRSVQGDEVPETPGEQTFWEVSSSGTGQQQLEWEPEEGDWTVVAMNADASRGVAADVEVGVEIQHLWAIIIGLLAGGVLVMAGGVVLIVFAARGASRRAPPPAPTGFGPPPAGIAAPEGVSAPGVVLAGAPARPTVDHPVVVTGRLAEPLSRWLWLVKWLLAIPHVIVLVVLWIVAIVLSVVAWFAILFTGRYPRAIFDFNVGVLRWTWRVAFYAGGVLATDRYPPFTLDARPDYPATLEVHHPERLSRGLVLVKSWLLAIPHYVIIGIFGSGLWWGTFGWGGDRWGPDGSGGWGGWGGGLVGVLVLIAAVRLLFTGRYPREMFALVMGLHRWAFRVAVYALLMTDVYPPFRLDQGGEDPGATDEDRADL